MSTEGRRKIILSQNEAVHNNSKANAKKAAKKQVLEYKFISNKIKIIALSGNNFKICIFSKINEVMILRTENCREETGQTKTKLDQVNMKKKQIEMLEMKKTI